VRLGCKLLFAAALAAGLAAFQLLPFFEYLANSRVLEQRSYRQTPLDWQWWPLMLFPDLLGNPAQPYKISINLPAPNYELVNMAYAGGVAMLLALVGGFIALRDRLARVFAIAAVLWLLYAYDLFGAYEVFRLIPGLDMAPMNRSQGLWNFLVACLAALAVDRLERRAGPRRWLAAAMYTVMALAGLFACLWGADAVLEQHALEESPHHRLFLETVPLHIKLLTALYLMSLGCVLVLLLSIAGACALLQACCSSLVCTSPPGIFGTATTRCVRIASSSRALRRSSNSARMWGTNASPSWAKTRSRPHQTSPTA